MNRLAQWMYCRTVFNCRFNADAHTDHAFGILKASVGTLRAPAPVNLGAGAMQNAHNLWVVRQSVGLKGVGKLKLANAKINDDSAPTATRFLRSATPERAGGD